MFGYSQAKVNRKTVLIIGGGFGGLAAAKALGKRDDVKVVLIDRRNYHLFQPLLYQVAMAGLSPADIAMPIRSILSKNKNTDVVLGTVTDVDLRSHKIKAGPTIYEYDYLVLACGAIQSYFGHSEWEPYAPGLKTLEQALEIRRRVLMAFELAEMEQNGDTKKKLLTFVVVGGGPTGVELAGALGEINRFTLRQDFHKIDPKEVNILLIEAGPRILPSFSVELSEHAVRDLDSLGVRVLTSMQVTNISSDGVQLKEQVISAGTVLWAAGVQATDINSKLGCDLSLSGRVIVGKDLSLPGRPEVFVIGDQAQVLGEDGNPLPGLAPVALQQGTYVAETIVRDLKKKPRQNFRYRDKGQMATIGRNRAIAELQGFKFKGLVAWIAWLMIHIYFLIGFKNRFIVCFQWFWSYLTYKRGARLILLKHWKTH